VLVWHDLLGLGERSAPKFVRRYADLRTASVEAVAAYADDVRTGAFPSEAESYKLSADQVDAMALYGGQPAA
jgi:3-methyl-2-oxobutanoate hydroxymethyltransferase